MAKTVRNAKLDSRAAREKLRSASKPYYMAVGQGMHLGFRKGKTGGKWVSRLYLGGERYLVETIALSDDRLDANGAGVLNFAQAQAAVRSRAEAHAEEARIASLGPVTTVRDALAAYIETREKREAGYHSDGRTPQRDARSRLTKHVLLADEKLAATPLAALTAAALAAWRDANSKRVTSDFKAALNSAARRLKAQLPLNFRDTIRDGLRAEGGASPIAREAQVLPDADVRRLIAAAWEVDVEGGWDGDLGRFVLALAATGARFSQIARMTVADVQVAQKRLMVPTSRKGVVKQLSHVGVRVGDDVLAALQAATAGRVGSAPLLLRPRWRNDLDESRPLSGRSFLQWAKAGRSAWRLASELTLPWGKITSRAGLPASTVPYALRHSSIVRGLRAGLPTRLVAALHDTSSLMIERHYAAFIVDAMDELAARVVIPLSPAAARPLKAVSP
jgi:integrase